MRQKLLGCEHAGSIFRHEGFHPFASSYSSTSLTSLYRQHERKKKREYGDRVREVEMGCFTPLVFSTVGGMGREAMATFKRLANLLAEKKNEPYSVVLGWLRVRMSFSLLRSALACLCVRRTKRNISDVDCIALASAEGLAYVM